MVKARGKTIGRSLIGLEMLLAAWPVAASAGLCISPFEHTELRYQIGGMASDGTSVYLSSGQAQLAKLSNERQPGLGADAREDVGGPGGKA